MRNFFLLIFFISSIKFILEDNPPWTQNIFLSIIASKDKRSKISVKYPYTFLNHIFSYILHAGNWIVNAKRRRNISTELKPQSTKSPMNKHEPPVLNTSIKSTNWLWMSPHIVTGTYIGWTFDSSISNSFVFGHNDFTSDSGMYSYRWSWDICLSGSLFFGCVMFFFFMDYLI